MNQRTLRDATVDLLKQQSSLIGVTIFNSKLTNVQVENLPSICVYVNAETAESREPNSAGFYTTYDLVIDLMIRADDRIDPIEDNWANLADTYEEAIKEALFTSGEWIDLSDGIQGYTVERELTDEGEYQMALTSITIVRDGYESFMINN